MEVFLFPLANGCLFPATVKPLNIFEPRYVQMVKDSIAQQKPIAIGFVEDPQEATLIKPGEEVSFVRQICGYGVPQIIEERSNGTLLVFLQGTGRARLGPVKDSGAPYLVCEAQALDEDYRLEDSESAVLVKLGQILVRWIQTHIPDPAQRDVFIRSIQRPEEVVGSFATYLVRDYDLQQLVLETVTLKDKIQILHRLAESNELTV